MKSNPSPLISVIIPFFNASRYLKESIESVISQTFDDWELILIDDGSTDDSVQIVTRLSLTEPRIKILSQKNAGQAAARNNGIKSSKAKFIAFLDADDIWVKNKLEVQLKHLESEKVDVIYSLGILMFENDNNRTEPYHWVTGRLDGMAMFEELTKSNFMNPGTVLLRRSIFDKVGLFDEVDALRGTEDFDLWMRITRAGFVVFGMDDHLAYYRVRATGEHTITHKQYYGKLYCYNKYLKDKSVPRKWFLKNYRFFARELMNILFEMKSYKEIDIVMRWLRAFDRYGPSTFVQYNLYKVLPLKCTLFLSNKIVYRIGYRFERLFYKSTNP